MRSRAPRSGLRADRRIEARDRARDGKDERFLDRRRRARREARGARRLVANSLRPVPGLIASIRCATMRGMRRLLAILFFAVLLPAVTIVAAEPAAMHVILLGTGYPRPDPDRAGPSLAIVAGTKWFVVDAGRGVTMRIAS